jgi:hypothetical protein
MSYKSDRLAECRSETERLNVEAFVRMEERLDERPREDDPFVTLVDEITACVDRFLPYDELDDDDSGDLKGELLKIVRTAAAQRLAELFGR